MNRLEVTACDAGFARPILDRCEMHMASPAATKAQIRLTPQVADEIIRWAMESRPRECCGIVMADAPDEALGVRVLRSENSDRLDPTTRYKLDHRTHIRAVEEEVCSGARIVAFYHSHPEADARPSRMDGQLAIEGVTYLVAGLAGEAGEAELRAWRWSGERFEEQAVLLEEPGDEEHRTPDAPGL